MPHARRSRHPPWFSSLTRLERQEFVWLIGGLIVCALLFLFLVLAGKVVHGDTQAFDTRIVIALRSPTDPSRPVGPAWVETMLLDLTALGGPTVLALLVLSTTGYLLLQGRRRTGLFILITAVSGALVNFGLKQLFARPRPTVVPHLRQASETSFPSGHAMESAIIYLTLGSMLMRIAEGRVTKIYCLTMAMLLTGLIGVSRVYLGVHYPTDVLAGWMVGMAWSCLCWLAAQRYEVRSALNRERDAQT